MHAKSLSAPWLVRITWDELLTLFCCLGLDFVEIAFPLLQAPIIGDFLDLVGLVFCFAFLGWVGLVSLLEIIPGLDVLPIFTLTWLIWYVYKRRRELIRLESQLEEWK